MTKKQLLDTSFLFVGLLFFTIIKANFPSTIKSNFQIIESDSLKEKAYKYLKKGYYKSGNNFTLAGIYANAYIKRAKKNTNNIEIANGYYLLSQISTEKRALELADSILLYGNKSNNKELLIKGNIQKGINYYYLANYDEALSMFLEAQKIAVKEKNEFQQIVVRHNIGNLKNVTNQRKEALEIFRDNIKYFNTKEKKEGYEQERQYLKSLFRLANIYNVLKKLDSAEIINKIGIKESLKSENKYMYPMFLACYGSTMQLSGRKEKALDSLKKSARLINNRKARLASIYLIISKIYREKGNYNEYENYLLKIDSIYTNHPEIIKETKISYEALVNFYRGNKNLEKQLSFMNKLIEVDSVLDIKFQNVNKDIARNYEGKNLISEKESIIKKLDRRKNKYLYLNLILITVVLFAILIIYRFYKKKRVYQARFKELIKDQSNFKNNTKNKARSTVQGSIPKEIETSILQGLNIFEEEFKFLDKNISLKQTATLLGTNTSYLSFVINSSKKKNFSKYISDLRIQYSIKKLTEDKKFRLYSIKAIANEVGFKSQEAFSKAFYKKTGIYPSHFINNLKNMKNKKLT
ncbi:helix-turn-helix domain-containing protein [Aquimarina muelleri]|uniref:HTH araC/xylS-type domain-containing protein n=1 Tax=Aquimarina muelleri TaxID=279356 RepID=A0A918JTS3_9FLAO|nr:helix-turn-helix domain-containing protein [Aquimarina muelleri]MCX2761566.1 helix-turn-helix domain-containing protein [Aquimarina muelleri]GGX07828.1 hypothetical protein GCM10007384_06980 [Aquimarina muelleri]